MCTTAAVCRGGIGVLLIPATMTRKQTTPSTHEEKNLLYSLVCINLHRFTLVRRNFSTRNRWAPEHPRREMIFINNCRKKQLSNHPLEKIIQNIRPSPSVVTFQMSRILSDKLGCATMQANIISNRSRLADKTEKHTDLHTHTCIYKHTHEQTNRHKEGQTDRNKQRGWHWRMQTKVKIKREGKKVEEQKNDQCSKSYHLPLLYFFSFSSPSLILSLHVLSLPIHFSYTQPCLTTFLFIFSQFYF